MTIRQRKKEYAKKLPMIVTALLKRYKPQKIILFGSMLNPKVPSNDIDLFLVKDTKLKRLGDRAEEAEKYVPFDDVPLDLIVYTPSEVEKYRNESVLLHEVFKGKVLHG